MSLLRAATRLSVSLMMFCAMAACGGDSEGPGEALAPPATPTSACAAKQVDLTRIRGDATNRVPAASLNGPARRDPAFADPQSFVARVTTDDLRAAGIETFDLPVDGEFNLLVKHGDFSVEEVGTIIQPPGEPELRYSWILEVLDPKTGRLLSFSTFRTGSPCLT